MRPLLPWLLLSIGTTPQAAELRGTILHASGRPAAGAQVEIVGGKGWSTTADEDGRFRAGDLSDDEALGVVVTAAGRPAIAFRTLIRVAPGAPPADETYVLPPSAAIEGLVTDTEGRAVAGVRIALAADTPWIACDASATTDVRGRFSAEGLPRGAITSVSATGTGAGCASAWLAAPRNELGLTVWPPTDESTWPFPGSGGPGDAVARIVESRGGDSPRRIVEIHADGLRVETFGRYAIVSRGVLSGVRERDLPPGELAAAATVTVRGGRDAPVLLIRDDVPEVIVRLERPALHAARVPAGTWRVVETESGHPPRRLTVAPGAAAAITLPASSSPTATVRVKDEQGRPIARAKIAVRAQGEPGAELTEWAAAAWPGLDTDSGGEARIRGCLRGCRVELTASAEGHLPARRVVVLEGVIDLVLASVPPRTRFRVRSPDPDSDEIEWISLRPLEAAEARPLDPVLVNRRVAEFEALPGPYLLSVTSGDRCHAERIVLPIAGAEREIGLDGTCPHLRPTRLRVRVEGADPSDPPSVTLRDQSGHATGWLRPAMEAGLFTWDEPLAEGEHQVLATSRIAAAATTIRTVHGGVTDLSLELVPFATLRVVALDEAAGTELPGAAAHVWGEQWGFSRGPLEVPLPSGLRTSVHVSAPVGSPGTELEFAL